MSAIKVESVAFEGTDVWNDGQVVIRSATVEDGVLATQSDVTGNVLLDIFAPGNSTPVYSATLSKLSVIFNTPQPWDEDSIGYNFSHQVRISDVGAGVLRGGRRYTMVYRVPTANDGEQRLVFIWKIEPLHI